jgi:membrane protease YdiL (CAAX protease family)
VPWGVREVVAATLAAIALVILVVGGAFGALFLLRSVIDTAPFARPVAIGAAIVYQLGFLAIALAVAWRRGGPAALGFRAFSPASLLAAGGLLVLGVTVQVAYGLALQALGLGQENPQRIDVLVGATPLSLAVALISGAVLAPIAEEAFFRGLVLPGLTGRLGTPGAVVVSSALFALAHLVPQVYLPIFVLGVFLALLRIWARSLWPAIALHSAFNAISLLAVFAVSQPTAAP